jgi:predicted anti-sigma-YlaC factor YlaD
MLLRGLGLVFKPAFTAARKRRCASSSLYCSLSRCGCRAMRKDLARDLKLIRKRSEEFKSLARDSWIKANSEIEAQRLHALGVVVFRWNLSEQKLLQLFWALLDRPESEVVALAHEVTDVGLAVRIRALAARMKANPALCDAITNVLDVFEACRQNRNQLAHFFPVLSFARSRLAKREDYLPPWDFERKERNPYALIKMPFPNAVGDIRRVAKDIARLNVALLAITLLVDRHFHPERTWPAPPLPRKLSVPKFLWKPPRPSRKERARPPRSSRA